MVRIVNSNLENNRRPIIENINRQLLPMESPLNTMITDPAQDFFNNSIPLEKLRELPLVQYDAIVSKTHTSGGETLIVYKGQSFYSITDVINAAVLQQETDIALFIKNGSYVEQKQIGTYASPVNINVTLVGESLEGCVITVVSDNSNPAWNIGGVFTGSNLSFFKTDNKRPLLNLQGNNSQLNSFSIIQEDIDATNGESGAIIIGGNNSRVYDGVISAGAGVGFSSSLSYSMPAIDIEANAEGVVLSNLTVIGDGLLTRIRSAADYGVVENGLYEITSTKGCGIYSNSDFLYWICRNTSFLAPSGANTCVGIELSYSNNDLKYSSIESCSFENFNYGIKVSGLGLVIQANQLRASNYHIHLTFPTTTVYTYTTVISNSMYDGQVYLGSGYCNFSNNVVQQIDDTSILNTLEINSAFCSRTVISGNRLVFGVLKLDSNILSQSEIVNNLWAIRFDDFLTPVNAGRLTISNNMATDILSSGSVTPITTGNWIDCVITGNTISQLNLPNLYGCYIAGNSMSAFFCNRMGGFSFGVSYGSTFIGNSLINGLTIYDQCIGALSDNYSLFGNFTIGEINLTTISGNKLTLGSFICSSISDSQFIGNNIFCESDRCFEATNGANFTIIQGNYLEGDIDADACIWLGASAYNGFEVSNNFFRIDNNSAGSFLYIDGDLGNGTFDLNGAVVSGNVGQQLEEGDAIWVEGNMYNTIITNNFFRANNDDFILRVDGAAQRNIITNNRVKWGSTSAWYDFGSSSNNFIGAFGLGQPNLTN